VAAAKVDVGKIMTPNQKDTDMSFAAFILFQLIVS